MSAAGPDSQETDAAELAGPCPWLLTACVLVLVAFCYVPVLGAPFIWDDFRSYYRPPVSRVWPWIIGLSVRLRWANPS